VGTQMNMKTENNLKKYFDSVKRDHKNPLVQKNFSFYAWFWFHTEFWLSPLDRRPYTFIFRDWIFIHMLWYQIMIAIWYAGLVAWLKWAPYASGTLIGVSSWLNAHLVWGGKWKKGEQEWPPFLDE
jgi:hypothetical protein